MMKLHTRVLTRGLADRILRNADNLKCSASYDMVKRGGKYDVTVEGENAKKVASKFPELTFRHERKTAQEAK